MALRATVHDREVLVHLAEVCPLIAVPCGNGNRFQILMRT